MLVNCSIQYTLEYRSNGFLIPKEEKNILIAQGSSGLEWTQSSLDINFEHKLKTEHVQMQETFELKIIITLNRLQT